MWVLILAATAYLAWCIYGFSKLLSEQITVSKKEIIDEINKQLHQHYWKVSSRELERLTSEFESKLVGNANTRGSSFKSKISSKPSTSSNIRGLE